MKNKLLYSHSSGVKAGSIFLAGCMCMTLWLNPWTAFATDGVNPTADEEIVETEPSTVSEWDGNLVNAGWSGKPKTPALTSYKEEVEGDGTTVTIGDAEGFAYFAYKVYSDTQVVNYNVNLECDIDLNNHMWMPIGFGCVSDDMTGQPVFSGTFNGNRHTIYNFSGKTFSDNLQFDENGSDEKGWLYVTYEDSTTPDERISIPVPSKKTTIKENVEYSHEYVYGLFGITRDAEIYNLNVEGVNVWLGEMQEYIYTESGNSEEPEQEASEASAVSAPLEASKSSKIRSTTASAVAEEPYAEETASAPSVFELDSDVTVEKDVEKVINLESVPAGRYVITLKAVDETDEDEETELAITVKVGETQVKLTEDVNGNYRGIITISDENSINITATKAITAESVTLRENIAGANTLTFKEGKYTQELPGSVREGRRYTLKIWSELDDSVKFEIFAANEYNADAGDAEPLATINISEGHFGTAIIEKIPNGCTKLIIVASGTEEPFTADVAIELYPYTYDLSVDAPEEDAEIGYGTDYDRSYATMFNLSGVEAGTKYTVRLTPDEASSGYTYTFRYSSQRYTLDSSNDFTAIFEVVQGVNYFTIYCTTAGSGTTKATVSLEKYNELSLSKSVENLEIGESAESATQLNLDVSEGNYVITVKAEADKTINVIVGSSTVTLTDNKNGTYSGKITISEETFIEIYADEEITVTVSIRRVNENAKELTFNVGNESEITLEDLGAKAGRRYTLNIANYFGDGESGVELKIYAGSSGGTPLDTIASLSTENSDGTAIIEIPDDCKKLVIVATSSLPFTAEITLELNPYVYDFSEQAPANNAKIGDGLDFATVFNLKDVNAGKYIITVAAEAGNTISVRVGRNTVALDDNGDGTYSGQITISNETYIRIYAGSVITATKVSIKDDNNLSLSKRVEGVEIGTEESATVFNLVNLSDGSYIITVKAESGKTIFVRVGRNTVTLDDNGDGTYRGTIEINSESAISIYADSEVNSATVFIKEYYEFSSTTLRADNVRIGTDEENAAELDLKNVTEGEYTITVRAGSVNTGLSSITVKVGTKEIPLEDNENGTYSGTIEITDETSIKIYANVAITAISVSLRQHEGATSLTFNAGNKYTQDFTLGESVKAGRRYNLDILSYFEAIGSNVEFRIYDENANKYEDSLTFNNEGGYSQEISLDDTYKAGKSYTLSLSDFSVNSSNAVFRVYANAVSGNPIAMLNSTGGYTATFNIPVGCTKLIITVSGVTSSLTANVTLRETLAVMDLGTGRPRGTATIIIPENCTTFTIVATGTNQPFTAEVALELYPYEYDDLTVRTPANNAEIGYGEDYATTFNLSGVDVGTSYTIYLSLDEALKNNIYILTYNGDTYELNKDNNFSVTITIAGIITGEEDGKKIVTAITSFIIYCTSQGSGATAATVSIEKFPVYDLPTNTETEIAISQAGEVQVVLDVPADGKYILTIDGDGVESIQIKDSSFITSGKVFEANKDLILIIKGEVGARFKLTLIPYYTLGAKDDTSKDVTLTVETGGGDYSIIIDLDPSVTATTYKFKVENVVVSTEDADGEKVRLTNTVFNIYTTDEYGIHLGYIGELRNREFIGGEAVITIPAGCTRIVLKVSSPVRCTFTADISLTKYSLKIGDNASDDTDDGNFTLKVDTDGSKDYRFTINLDSSVKATTYTFNVGNVSVYTKNDEGETVILKDVTLTILNADDSSVLGKITVDENAIFTGGEVVITIPEGCTSLEIVVSSSEKYTFTADISITQYDETSEDEKPDYVMHRVFANGVGALIGYAIGDLTIEKCTTGSREGRLLSTIEEVPLERMSQVGSAGGLVGIVQGNRYGKVNIKDCTNYVNVGESDEDYAKGGIIGCAENIISLVFETCKNFGNVSGAEAGGIIGYWQATADNVDYVWKFTDCINYGNINGKLNIGGIAGRGGTDEIPEDATYSLEITNCKNHGRITNVLYDLSVLEDGEGATGGIVGILHLWSGEDNSITFTGNYNYEAVVGVEEKPTEPLEPEESEEQEQEEQEPPNESKPLPKTASTGALIGYLDFDGGSLAGTSCGNYAKVVGSQIDKDVFIGGFTDSCDISFDFYLNAFAVKGGN